METVQQYQCPSCGAPLVFNGETQTLHCESCENNFSVETLEQVNESVKATSEQSKFDWEHYEARSFDEDEAVDLGNYICKSCGAQVIGDASSGAMTCLYCGNTIIVEKQFDGGLKPDFIIPFKVDKKDAMKRLKESCKGKKFLPRDFTDESKLKEIRGVYVPFWTADCNCDANVTYHATRVSSWRSGNYRYTKTDHFTLYRSGELEFERIPVDASEKADDAYMDAIEPYDYSDAVDFNTAYLSGYFAGRYDVKFEECVGRINARIQKTTEDRLAATAQGYNTVTKDHSTVSCSHGKLRYALMPVWMLNVKYNNKLYKFAMNGQTGKLIGEYPIVVSKAILYFIKTFLISGALFSIVAFLLAKGGII